MLVDRDTVRESDDLLELLLCREGIVVSNYGDAGPPPDVERTPDDFFPPTAIGWVTVGRPSDDGPFVGRSLLTATKTTVSERSLLALSVDHLRLTLEGSASTQVNESDVVLFAVAEELEIDLLITGRPWLLESPLANGPLQVRSPSGAVPAIALYLRGTDDSPAAVSRTLTEFVTPVSHYFFTIVEEYLPSLKVVEEHLGTGGIATERQLIEAVHRKLGSAFARRDMVWRLALQHPTIAQLDEMAAEVDAFLLFLTSALDALARVLDSSLSLNSQRNKIGFQQENWRTNLASKLADGFSFTDIDLNAIGGVSGLRNFTHGTGARTLPVDIGEHRWKKTATYALYEYQGSEPKWQDPLDALNALRNTKFASRFFDMWRLRDSPEVFITPGPMCDLLLATTLSLIESVSQALVQIRGVAQVVKKPDGPRISAHIRKQQIFAFMGVHGFGSVEGLS